MTSVNKIVDRIKIADDKDASETRDLNKIRECEESPADRIMAEIGKEAMIVPLHAESVNIIEDENGNLSGLQENEHRYEGEGEGEEEYSTPSLSGICAMLYAQNTSITKEVDEDVVEANQKLPEDGLHSGEMSPLVDVYRCKEYGDVEEEGIVALPPHALFGKGGMKGLPGKCTVRQRSDTTSVAKSGHYEESKNTEEVLYWRQEVIQKHMESYPMGTFNPAISTQASSYCITAGFDDSALTGNPYTTSGDDTNSKRTKTYINFFAFEKKFLNENGKEMVQILKIWISPFWRSFQFLARFFFITMPFFGLNLILEFNYLLFRIAKRIAVFWMESMLYIFFFMPLKMAESTVRMLLSFLFKAPVAASDYTHNGIRILKSVKNGVNKFKSGKLFNKNL